MGKRFSEGAILTALAAVISALAVLGAEASLAGQIRSPHSKDACLDCHRDRVKGGNPQGLPVIILPEGDDPHRVLVNTCAGCHPKALPPFWLLTFPGKTPVGPAAAAPVAPSAAAAQLPGEAGFPNPHDTMECGKCHKNAVSFGAVTGGEKDLVGAKGDLSDFCQGCHQDISSNHFPRENLPLGSTTCLSCHSVHRPTTISPSLRGDYYTFIRETRDVNPHGGDVFCLVCHPSRPLPGEPTEFLFGEGDLNRICLRCHPNADHHVIDKEISKRTWKMEFLGYPLQDGKLACVTCHDPHGGLTKKDGGGFSLRGEPYPRMLEFCIKCHEEKEWRKINAHDQLMPGGDIITSSCLFCHASAPDVSERSLAPDDFNDTYTAICTQCHEPFIHPEVEHVLEPSAETLGRMKDFETRREVSLPVDFDGKVTCVTCHNPHEKGLLTGPESVGADEKKRLRLTTFNEICTPCHGRH